MNKGSNRPEILEDSVGESMLPSSFFLHLRLETETFPEYSLLHSDAKDVKLSAAKLTLLLYLSRI